MFSITQQNNRKTVNCVVHGFSWRTGWDSNPRAGLNTDKLISSDFESVELLRS